MVRHEITDVSNQNADNCVSTRPLSGIAEPEHVVEGRDAIGRDDQQVLRVHLVDVAHLAPAMERQSGKDGVEKWRDWRPR